MTYKPILLGVTGLTPQVITETLYACYQQPLSMPEEIHILTTQEGYQRARLTLINEGWLSRFYRDYGLSPITFNESYIHILHDQESQPLTDIRTEQDNQTVADGITEWIRLLTMESGTELHVSLAGGRKTMGFYAGYALSLYGRPQDRLSHVLVSADFESHPQFFYPTPYSHVIYANDITRKPLDTQAARITLADIPFVRLRHGLDKALLEGKSSFSATVARAQAALAPPHLVIDLPKRLLIVQDIPIKLSPTNLAFYLWLLHRQNQTEPAPTCPSEGAPELAYAQEYLTVYQRITGNSWAGDRTRTALKTGMSKAFFEQRKSQVNAVFKKNLPIAAPTYAIHAEGKRPKTCYQIVLTQEQITTLSGK